MAEFTLPANSRVKPGKTHKAPAGAKRVRAFSIYRWNPDDGQNPHTDTYEIDRIGVDRRVGAVVWAPAIDVEAARPFRARRRRIGLAGADLGIGGKGEFDHFSSLFTVSSFVIPGSVPGSAWMAGTSPAMTARRSD